MTWHPYPRGHFNANVFLNVAEYKTRVNYSGRDMLTGKIGWRQKDWERHVRIGTELMLLLSDKPNRVKGIQLKLAQGNSTSCVCASRRLLSFQRRKWQTLPASPCSRHRWPGGDTEQWGGKENTLQHRVGRGEVLFQWEGRVEGQGERNRMSVQNERDKNNKDKKKVKMLKKHFPEANGDQLPSLSKMLHFLKLTYNTDLFSSTVLPPLLSLAVSDTWTQQSGPNPWPTVLWKETDVGYVSHSLSHLHKRANTHIMQNVENRNSLQNGYAAHHNPQTYSFIQSHS